MKLYGLMITKDDHAIFDEWCRDQLRLYDAVVCLDGSEGDATARITKRYSRRLVYLHERDYDIPHITCHGLRGVVHDEIVRRFGSDSWVMCCHADELCYHDPRKVARDAEAEEYDAVSWYSLHFYPHPSELADWAERQHLPVLERFRHYHWNHRGSGRPWSEARLYRNGPQVAWDGVTHCNTAPHGLKRRAPFCGILRHYKVFTTDLSWYGVRGDVTYYRKHWVGQEHRTGLPFPVRRLEDLFVDSIPNYESCDRFDRTIPYEWNMGEEYRPDVKGGVRLLR